MIICLLNFALCCTVIGIYAAENNPQNPPIWFPIICAEFWFLMIVFRPKDTVQPPTIVCPK